jgi:hypothetical protein
VVQGTPFGLFYNSYDLSSKAFCLAWILATSWYLTINIARSKIQNYFRIRTPFDQADYIQIKKPRKVIQMHSNQSSNGRSGLMPALASLESIMRQLLGFDMLTTTVPVNKTDTGHCYFEFQSTRYHLDPHTQTFKPAVIADFFSMYPRDLIDMSEGLESGLAKARLQTLGPNFIEVLVPSFIHAFWEE